jgi:hypothetical protein
MSPPELISPVNYATYQPAKNLILRWNEIPGTSVFRVQYAIDTTFAFAVLKGDFIVSGNQLAVSDLEKNRVYFWRVKSEAESSWSAVWKFTTTGMPVKPFLKTPAANSTNLNLPVKFSWSFDSVNANYMLQISESVNFASPQNIIVADTSFTGASLQYGKTYFWRVKGLNVDFDESAWSDSMQFRTKLPAPLLETPLNASVNNDTSVIFSWEKTLLAESYILEISADSLFSQGAVFKRVDTSNTRLVINGLNFTSDYFWHVYAYNKAGDYSNWSDTVRFRTKFPAPQPIFPADSARELDTSVIFTWLAQNNAYQYRLQVSRDTLFKNLLADSLTSLTQVKNDSLLYGKAYYWRLNSRNKTGDTSSWTAVRTFSTQLPKPRLLLPRSDSVNAPTNIDFSLSAVDSAAFYRVQVAYDTLFSAVFADTLIKKPGVSIKYLLNDTVYYWRGKALKADTLTGSKWSAISKFKTKPALSISPVKITDTLNLSDRFTDTLSSIVITNFGVNKFNIDKALVYPDTLFYLTKQSSPVLAGSQTAFTIKIYPERFKPGLTKGKAYFIRKSVSPADDTLTVDISLFIKKAIAVYHAESITFGNAYAGNTYIKNFIISNADGNMDLKINRRAITGPDTAYFKLLDTINTVPAGGEKNLRISFKPLKTGKYTAELEIATNSFRDTLGLFLISAYGLGGTLDDETISSITGIGENIFETFTNNTKRAGIKNSGNSPLNLKFSFRNNYFTIDNQTVKTLTLYPEDSVGVSVKYITPDLNKQNKDTMYVTGDGFNRDTIIVPLKGGFDGLEAKNFLAGALKINGISFISSSRIFPEQSKVTFSLPPDIFSDVSNAGFRLKYFTGGGTELKTVLNDGGNNFTIQAGDVNLKGFVFKCDFYVSDKSGKPVDSLEIIPLTDAQVLLSSYVSPEIYLPRSTPANKAEDAISKWKFIGFPFDNVAVDSVFRVFGGRKTMRDGEWVLYKYNPEGKGSFTLFNDFYFEPLNGYFAAQGLTDSLAIEGKYYGNLLTRKLTDTLIKFSGNGWKTVTSPFTFDVGINSDIPLRRYDAEKKSYFMTYVMKPGEAYFAEPSVSYLSLKTFGEFYSLSYPKLLNRIGWHTKITASTAGGSAEALLSLNRNSNGVQKTDYEKTCFVEAPQIAEGFEFYIRDNNTGGKLTALTINSEEGGVWSLAVKNNKDCDVKISVENIGGFPSNYKLTLVENARPVPMAAGTVEVKILKGAEKNLKVIIGSEEFTKAKLIEIRKNLVFSFSLEQNYPNPFNPSTTIKYIVPGAEWNIAQKVQLRVYNALGGQVAELVNDYKQPGEYDITFDAGKYASGVYFYRLACGKNIITKKMILVK